MKRFASFLFVASAIALAASCAKEINVDNADNNGKEIQITVIASEKPLFDAETRTYIDGTSVKWANSGEKIKVFEVATPVEGEAETTSAVSSDGVTNDNGATMKFGVSMTAKDVSDYSAFDYYAVYPSSAYQTGTTVSSIALNTKAAQTPSATNFDPTQDLLIAKKVENGGSQATTLDMEFARLVAVGKMTIKNLGTTDEITKIRFSAKKGTGESATPIILAGRTAFNLETACPVSSFGSNAADHEIILDYEGQGITANSSTGMVAYFLCYPFTINSENPGSFQVIVETAAKTFTKDVSVSSAKGLSFVTGKSSVFSVDMNGITGEDKEVDLRYAYLDYNDFMAAGGATSYSNVTVNKAHGDSWVMYAISSNDAIGVRRNDKDDNDSYIKLPDFKENINKVVVTLKNVTASKTITLESSATANDGSIASLTTTSATVYTFDLTSASVKTAYFRSHDAQAMVEKIEAYAGTDNRTALSNPENVEATLNANTTNSIDVSWNSVQNAGGYLISLLDANSNETIFEATSSPYTATGLNYETVYSVSVTATPADPYLYKNSDQASAANTVTTGAAPGGAKWVLVSSIGEITAGDKYLLATNDKAHVYNGAVSSGHLQVVEVTPGNNQIADSDLPTSAAQIEFVSAGSANKYYLKVGNTYISLSKAGSGGFLNNETTAFEWTFSNSDATGGGMNALGTKYAAYIRSYNNNSFRSYTGTSNGATFFLYKYVSGGETPTPTTYSVTIADGIQNGTVTASPSSDIAPGTSVTLTISPNLGFELSSLTVDGENVTSSVSSGQYTFDMPAHDVEVSAEFTVSSVTPGEETTVEIAMSSQTATDGVITFTQGGLTFTFSKNTGSTNPQWNDNSSELRLYPKGTLSVSGKTITRIVYEYNINPNKSGKVPSLESVVGATNEGSWDNDNTTWSDATGDSNVTMTLGGEAGNFGFTKVTVTYK